MKQIPGIDIGPLRGIGLGLGGETVTPPPRENPPPEDGGETDVGPGVSIVGPPPVKPPTGGKPKPGDGEGEPKPEEKPEPEEAEHIGKSLLFYSLLTPAVASLRLRHASLVEYMAFLPYYGGACIPQT